MHSGRFQISDFQSSNQVMSVLTISLPEARTQRAFNLRRWDELLRDRHLAKIAGRIETDRYGRII